MRRQAFRQTETRSSFGTPCSAQRPRGARFFFSAASNASISLVDQDLIGVELRPRGQGRNSVNGKSAPKITNLHSELPVALPGWHIEEDHWEISAMYWNAGPHRSFHQSPAVRAAIRHHDRNHCFEYALVLQWAPKPQQVRGGMPRARSARPTTQARACQAQWR